MKKAFIVFIAAVATIACTKESSIQDKNLTPEGGLLSIEATVSPFVDDATKASISVNGSGDVTGTFTWSEGDQIAFPVTGSPAYVALTYNPENGKFEGKANDGQAVDNTRQIVYPASRVIGSTYSTDFASVADAKAGFKMTASVPASLSEKITMTHESALVHVQFTNVPDFANELVVSDGSSNVATIPASEGTVDFYAPITPAGSKTYSFSIKEGSNVIKSVSKTISLTAGKYYNTPSVSIGRIIRVIDSVDWGSKELYIWNTANTLENKCFTVGSDYPYKLLTNSSNNHYIVVPSELSWANTATKVGVKFQDSGASHSTQTDGVYLLRNITFNVPAELGMRTDYRIYPISSTGGVSSVTLYSFYQPYKIYVKNSSGGDIVLHTWQDGKSGVDITQYDIDGDFCVFTLSRSWKDIKCNFGFKHSNGNDWGGNQNVTFTDSYQQANLEYKGSNNTSWLGGTNSIAADVLNGAWPGNSISGLTTTVSADKFFEVPSSYYNKEVSFKFNSGGTEWYPVMNQDYNYDIN